MSATVLENENIGFAEIVNSLFDYENRFVQILILPNRKHLGWFCLLLRVSRVASCSGVG